MSTGWTWDYVCWNVDLPRLAALTKYWKLSPPFHVLFRHYVGYKPPQEVKPISEEEQNSQMEHMMASAPKYVFKPPQVRMQ